MGVEEDKSSCTDGICECAVQGRALMNASSGKPGNGFGLHSIKCTEHPYGTVSLEDMEKKIQEKMDDFSSYHPFMDYITQFYTTKLDSVMDSMISDGKEFLGLKWTSDYD